uniref:Uncharacterized protein n=1 Tax=Steinernema glaseri TaxID=37863 RepID=A0A1I7ZQJ4_9BILA
MDPINASRREKSASSRLVSSFRLGSRTPSSLRNGCADEAVGDSRAQIEFGSEEKLASGGRPAEFTKRTLLWLDNTDPKWFAANKSHESEDVAGEGRPQCRKKGASVSGSPGPIITEEVTKSPRASLRSCDADGFRGGVGNFVL